MTAEEAIKIIKSECYVFNPLNLDRTQMVNTALDMACKALEQEPKTDTLDKIIERIELEKFGYPPSAGYYKAIMKCLQIIDDTRQKVR